MYIVCMITKGSDGGGDLLLTPRLRREYRTMECMVAIWCADHHADPTRRGEVCEDCRAFLAYAERRLEKCPYGEAKPTCAKCPIHCYKRAQREQARVIMAYAGPRMTYRHPWLALMHLVDKVRKVEHPMEVRRRKAKQDAESPPGATPDNMAGPGDTP